MLTKSRATIEHLYDAPGKAELIEGEIVLMSPTGHTPGRASGRIYASLDRYERRKRSGFAYPDNVGFRVNLPHRESFSPKAAFHTGPATGMKFIDGAPDFAVEVCSEEDYGPIAEADVAAKRADYFEAGTKVVWDVDMKGKDVIRVYRRDNPGFAAAFGHGGVADAEPAVPGWRFKVVELFE
jgi:Uma2 family endonuclease